MERIVVEMPNRVTLQKMTAEEYRDTLIDFSYRVLQNLIAKVEQPDMDELTEILIEAMDKIERLKDEED